MDDDIVLLVPPDYGALRTEDILHFLKVSRSKFLDMVRKGEFPAGSSLTDDGRAVLWTPAQANSWWRGRMQARDVSLQKRQAMTAPGTAASIKARASTEPEAEHAKPAKRPREPTQMLERRVPTKEASLEARIEAVWDFMAMLAVTIFDLESHTQSK